MDGVFERVGAEAVEVAMAVRSGRKHVATYQRRIEQPITQLGPSIVAKGREAQQVHEPLRRLENSKPAVVTSRVAAMS